MVQIYANFTLTAIQALSFAFLQAFLPHSVYKQYQKAKKYHLINDLGRPNVSSFAAYAYSASLHIDKDVCLSHGWVYSHSKEVDLYCHSANFHLTYSTCLADHKERVEFYVW